MIKQRIHPELNCPTDQSFDYYRHLLPESMANDLYNALINQLVWKQESIIIFGKEVLSPRHQCFYGDPEVEYRYSGKTFHATPWTASLLTIKEHIEQLSGHTFNAVLCNLYRSGQDSMGWHSDNEKELGQRPVIASYSLGEKRSLSIRKVKETKQLFSLPLDHNSLLIMKEQCQWHYQHAIPKTKKAMKPRINLTFRHFFE